MLIVAVRPPSIYTFFFKWFGAKKRLNWPHTQKAIGVFLLQYESLCTKFTKEKFKESICCIIEVYILNWLK